MATIYYSFGKNGKRHLPRNHTLSTLRSEFAHIIRDEGIKWEQPIYFWTGPTVKTHSGILLAYGAGPSFYWFTRNNCYEYYIYSDGDKMKKVKSYPAISRLKQLLKE